MSFTHTHFAQGEPALSGTEPTGCAETNPVGYRLQTYLWSDGERFCHLQDLRSGLPHQPSLLYCITRRRNASLSLSAMQLSLNAVHIALIHFNDSGIDLTRRFTDGQYLTPDECEKLRGAAQVHLGRGRKSSNTVVALGQGKRGYKKPKKAVKSSGSHGRLTEIANYVKWFAEDLGGSFMENPERATQVAAMHSNILELRPAKRDLSGDPEKNAWSAEEDRLLLDLIRPGSPGNPFVGRGPQLRNQLCIQTERTLGKRMSEVLNIQVRDVDVRRNQVSFIRRPDAKEDQRVDQPLVKTKEHTISVSPEWIKLFLEYLEIRRKVPGARRHPYLFVNHKAGPTQGQPMTKGALNAVFVAIKKAEPRLSDLHSHLFRHNFNFELSESLDRQPTKSNDDQDAKIRANLNGWSEQSEMARVYNKRHVARRARELGLMTQERLHQKGNSVASPHDQPKPGSRHEP